MFFKDKDDDQPKANHQSSPPTHPPFFYKPYSDFKRSALFFQLMYLGLGMLLITLGAIVILKNPNWACDQFFWSCHIAKGVAITISFVLGFIAFGLGFKMKIEKEIALYLQKKAKRRIMRIYRREGVSRLGLKPLLLKALQDIDMLAKKNEPILMDIASDEQLPSITRENLFNEALFTFKQELDLIVQEFFHQSH